MVILVTGSTGFIGKRLIPLLSEKVDKIFILVRKESMPKAASLFTEHKNVHFIEGNIQSNDVCAKVEDLTMLIQETEHILHLAGGYDLEMSVLDAYTQNVIGVQNALELARKFKKLKYFHHVSTYAVNAYKNSQVLETDPLEDSSHLDHYARSKLQGEKLVEKTDLGQARKRIYRPGIVVGDSKTGKIEKVDGPYYFLQMLNKFKKYGPWLEKIGTLPIPCSKKAKLPIVPVDFLAHWLLESLLNPSDTKDLKIYHFMSEHLINLNEFVEMCLKELDIKCSVLPVKANFLSGKVLQKMGIPKELALYMFSEATYSTKNRLKDFPTHKEYRVEQIIPSLIEGSNIFFNGEKE